jgi:hypothetical protein
VLRVSFVLTAVCVLVAACGSSSTPTKAEYAASVVTTRNRVDYALAQITQAKTKQQFLDQMIDSSKLIDDAAGDLDDAGAAAGFDDETKKLVAAIRQLAVDLEATSEQIQTPGYEGLFSAKGLSFQSWVDVNAVLANLAKQGIDVEPLGRH